jgi:c-di-GMP-related signal transduction protein
MSLFVARQPILDARQNIVAYELLFRSGAENLFSSHDGDSASLTVLGTTLCHLGFDELTGGRRAFINFTRDLILQGYGSLLPQDRVVIEILEQIKPSGEVLGSCRELRREGYRLALDDVCTLEGPAPYIGLVDVLKVDWLRTDPDLRLAIAERYRDSGVRLLAEKIETFPDLEEALAGGYELFQGFYFSRPMILSSKATPTRRSTDFLLLQEIVKPDFDIDRVETIIKHDPVFSLKLLRYINSAAFGFRSELHSIRQAIVMLGKRKLRRWAVVLIVTGFTEQKPALLNQAVVRARFAENLADPFGLARHGEELFMTGLFSLMDAILDQPMESILESVNVAPEIVEALRGDATAFRDVLEMVRCYETGDWDGVAGIAARYAVDEAVLPEHFAEAVGWAHDLVSETRPQVVTTR